MKSWFTYICLFAGCVLSLPSCTYDEVIDADTTETSVELTLSYADAPMSRDVGTKENADGLDYTTEAQCALDIDDIYILAFNADNDQLIGLVEDLYFEEDGDNRYYTRKIKGRMRPLQTSTSVYFAVLTNLNQNGINSDMVAFLNGMKDQESDDVYQKLIFTTTDGHWITNAKRIPMWGKTGKATLEKNSLIDCSCSLYRALAKVQIWVNHREGLVGTDGESGTDDDFIITSIVVNNSNAKGYCVSEKIPNNDDIAIQYQEASVPNDNGELSVVYTPTGEYIEYEIEGSDSKVMYNDATQAYSDFIYLPEHLNVEGDEVTLTIHYRYNGNDGEGTIYFKNYEDDTPWQVVRNHSYIFNITGVNTAVDVESPLQYQVMDWTPINNGTLEFGNGAGAILTPAN